MNPQQQTDAVRVNTFGEDGETEETMIAAPEEAVEQEVPAEEPEPEIPVPTAPLGKYRIGDRVFETQEAALEYAQSQVQTLEKEQLIADAYQQGIRAASQQLQQPPVAVTPPQDDFNPEELYTDPKAALEKYARKVKEETLNEVTYREQTRAQSEQIWNEFTSRHPMLAEFRSEVEDFAQKDMTAVQAIIATKGRPAAYDYIATKLKARAAAIAEAAKPKRELPNVSTAVSPGSKAPSVTPKAKQEKPLSMAEQIRNMKKRR